MEQNTQKIVHVVYAWPHMTHPTTYYSCYLDLWDFSRSYGTLSLGSYQFYHPWISSPPHFLQDKWVLIFVENILEDVSNDDGFDAKTL